MTRAVLGGYLGALQTMLEQAVSGLFLPSAPDGALRQPGVYVGTAPPQRKDDAAPVPCVIIRELNGSNEEGTRHYISNVEIACITYVPDTDRGNPTVPETYAGVYSLANKVIEVLRCRAIGDTGWCVVGNDAVSWTCGESGETAGVQPLPFAIITIKVTLTGVW